MASAAHKAPPLGTIIGGGRYTLLRFLGSGAIGAVYEASTPSDERVAVKVLLEIEHADLSKELSTRFVREARVASTLDSPHIVPVVDSGLDEQLEIPYLVMPLLSGFDFDALLERTGSLHPTVAVRIVAQACRGLEVAHRASIVHRDIKPGNLFLDHHPNGAITVRVLDFGMAKLTSSEENITRAGAILGTPHYMSPEQSTNSKNVDARTDIWGLGATLYHALTGKVPFEEERSFADLHLAINAKDIMPIQERAPWIDPGLAKVVHGTLLRAVSERCPSAAALTAALEPFVFGATDVNTMMLEPVPRVLRAATSPRARTVDCWDPGVPTSHVPPVSAEPVDALLGRVVGGRYTLLRRLGTSAGLYEALDTDGNRHAVRVLDPGKASDVAAGKRVVREARALLAIKSPHVVQLMDADFDAVLKQPFLVMELLHGLDLERVIDKHGALEPRVAVPLFVQACRGLEAAHALGIVHRDVQPGNLFLQEQPSGEVVVKLTGFAFVKRLSSPLDPDTHEVTRASDVLGHPMYMSPEQARNPAGVDAKSDIWSLGATMFHALTGVLPWPRDLVGGALLLRIGTGSPPHAQDVAPWLDKPLAELLHHTLRPRAAERIATVALIADALVPLSRKTRVLLKDLGPLPTEMRQRVAPRAAPVQAEISLSPVSTSTPALSPSGPEPLSERAVLERRSRARTGRWIAVIGGVAMAALVGGIAGYKLVIERTASGQSRKTHAVRLEVSPPRAEVTVDGLPQRLVGGVLVLTGESGRQFEVVATLDGDSERALVVIHDDGTAVPAVIRVGDGE